MCPPCRSLPPDYYQPYLGGASCLQCNATADPRYTSYAGDDYCMVEWVDTTCSNGESAGCFDELRAPAAAGRLQCLFLGFPMFLLLLPPAASAATEH